ncbi:MAG: hypothetical protein IPL11_19630 [Candidatus Accumulibacter sp.]|nr:hypothetical protein [Accumulibacter sp.]
MRVATDDQARDVEQFTLGVKCVITTLSRPCRGSMNSDQTGASFSIRARRALAHDGHHFALAGSPPSGSARRIDELPDLAGPLPAVIAASWARSAACGLPLQQNR